MAPSSPARSSTTVTTVPGINSPSLFASVGLGPSRTAKGCPITLIRMLRWRVSLPLRFMPTPTPTPAPAAMSTPRSPATNPPSNLATPFGNGTESSSAGATVSRSSPRDTLFPRPATSLPPPFAPGVGLDWIVLALGFANGFATSTAVGVTVGGANGGAARRGDAIVRGSTKQSTSTACTLVPSLSLKPISNTEISRATMRVSFAPRTQHFCAHGKGGTASTSHGDPGSGQPKRKTEMR